MSASEDCGLIWWCDNVWLTILAVCACEARGTGAVIAVLSIHTVASMPTRLADTVIYVCACNTAFSISGV